MKQYKNLKRIRNISLLYFACSSVACGNAVEYDDVEISYVVINDDSNTMDSAKIKSAVQSALGDASKHMDISIGKIENTKIVFDYHENNPFLCVDTHDGSCIINNDPMYYVEVNLAKDSPYSHTYHETMHYILWLGGMDTEDHHKWMVDKGLCGNQDKVFGTHCSDVK